MLELFCLFLKTCVDSMTVSQTPNIIPSRPQVLMGSNTREQLQEQLITTSLITGDMTGDCEGSPDLKSPDVYCTVCGITFNSDKQSLQHYAGKLHAKKRRLDNHMIRCAQREEERRKSSVIKNKEKEQGVNQPCPPKS